MLDPYTTQQFVQYENDDPLKPKRISCKFKSADHLNEHYGAGTALDPPRSCRDLNRRTIVAVYRTMDGAQRKSLALPPTRILLDPDDVQVMGSRYVTPYPFVYRTAGGDVHVQAKALMVEWASWRWMLAPQKFRGAYYCHLIAPEYAARLMRGELELPLRQDRD